MSPRLCRCILAATALFLGSRALPADPRTPTSPLSTLVLKAQVAVDGRGVFLSQVAEDPDQRPLPEIRILPAPGVGTPLALTRARLQQLLAQPEIGLNLTNWSGATSVLVSRRMRPLEEAEVVQLLTSALQERCVRDRGELELRLGRPWTAVQVPDEALTIRLVDVPSSGLTPSLMVRFELLAGKEPAGSWQAVLQAKVWREVWVARDALRRGQGLSESDLVQERRDVLTLREVLASPSWTMGALQAAENISAGTALLQRHLRLQPVVYRGQSVNAMLEDGLMNLTMKVEVLEDGAPGQVVRLRNPSSRREFRGKVQNEKLITVLM